jgi:hypothetical protein
MEPWKKFESTVVRLKRSYEDTGSVVCLTTKGRQLKFIYVSTVFDISIDDLSLSPGIAYRIVLKLCAKNVCFQTINTDGVLIMVNPPVTSGITVEL